MDRAALYRRRRIVNFINLGISMLTVLFGLFWLVWILWTLFAQGLSAISLSMFTQTTAAGRLAALPTPFSAACSCRCSPP
jgi:ABC-type phosphate transport system permease subunit